MTSSKSFFCTTSTPKQKDLFTLINDREQQQILTFMKLLNITELMNQISKNISYSMCRHTAASDSEQPKSQTFLTGCILCYDCLCDVYSSATHGAKLLETGLNVSCMYFY